MRVNRLEKRKTFALFLAAPLLLGQASAQVPALLNYQGRVLVSSNAFTGTGQFKFALVNAGGSQIYWGNSPDNGTGQPGVSVGVPVNSGLFLVTLGDTNLANMALLPLSLFTNSSLFLRIWFNDGTHGVVQLAPDQPVTSAGYAMMAANVADGTITPAKLAPNTASTITASLAAQVAGLSAQVTVLSSQLSTLSNTTLGSGLTMASANPQDPALLAQGLVGFASFPAASWMTSSASGAPSARSGQAGVWTGQELIVWGGHSVAGVDFATGGRYRPDLDSWQTVSTLNAPSARSQHTAVWSGQQMIIWGGMGAGTFLGTGARFNPSNQVWTAMNTTNAPSGRTGHIAVWTGSRLVVWGGRNNGGLLADGAAYDPVGDQWTALPAVNRPVARCNASVVWTGSRAVIWGGQNEVGGLSSGAQLLCDVNGLPLSWAAVSASALAGRSGHAAVWTGQKMLIWGGSSTGTFLGDGAVYDPVADAWTATSALNPPSPRSGPAVVWTGVEMLIFGGESAAGTAGDGAAYNPAAGVWRVLSGAGSPLARSGATAGWSGVELLLFGGLSNGAALGSLQRLNPQPAWYLFRKP